MITLLLFCICENIRHSRISYLFLITLTLVQSLQSSLLFSKDSSSCVKAETYPSQLALLFRSCLCLRFIATLYLLCLSGRLQLRHSWPPSSLAVCHGGDVQYRDLQTNVCLLLYLLSVSLSGLLSTTGLRVSGCIKLSAGHTSRPEYLSPCC